MDINIKSRERIQIIKEMRAQLIRNDIAIAWHVILKPQHRSDVISLGRLLEDYVARVKTRINRYRGEGRLSRKERTVISAMENGNHGYLHAHVLFPEFTMGDEFVVNALKEKNTVVVKCQSDRLNYITKEYWWNPDYHLSFNKEFWY